LDYSSILLNAQIAITTTLEAQNASFAALANKIATLDADLQRLKALYTQLWRAKTGSMRDPFNQLDRGSGEGFGVESFYGK
jgi:nucleoporin p58/p45